MQSKIWQKKMLKNDKLAKTNGKFQKIMADTYTFLLLFCFIKEFEQL